jgi:hypothetical protein
MSSTSKPSSPLRSTLEGMGNDNVDFVSRLWPFLTTALGVALGLLAEPVKARVLRKSELKLARQEIYCELGGYIAAIERVQSGLGHGEHSEEVRGADFESSKRICKSPPKFEVIQWYKSNRMDLLLRIDRKRGIRMLSEGLVALHEDAQAPGRLLGLPKRILDFLRQHEACLDGLLLRRCISNAHKEEAGLEGKV